MVSLQDAVILMAASTKKVPGVPRNFTTAERVIGKRVIRVTYSWDAPLGRTNPPILEYQIESRYVYLDPLTSPNVWEVLNFTATSSPVVKESSFGGTGQVSFSHWTYRRIRARNAVGYGPWLEI